MRPDIFHFHDHIEFLTEWFAFLKVQNQNFSLRKLSRDIGFSPGYLSLVLTKKRKLTPKATDKLLPVIKLNPTEQSYFKLMRSVDNSKTQGKKIEALKKLQRYRDFKKTNPKEITAYQYLTKWYYVAIHELAATNGFKSDPKWIQKRLLHHVPLEEINKAIEFLFESGLLIKDEQGKTVPKNKDIRCAGGIFDVVLAQFHRQMLDLAGLSIDKTPRGKRSLTGYTFSIPKESLNKVKEIIENAERQISELEKQGASADSVYHVEFALFPLTGA